ncbi:hypothetical protein MUK42_32294 [Musa troglodytarum]|uniref:Uncharacterized protein n=1 Tax=Musa troglodytarum TaxID=320322 RepID=A0A9E7FNZ2_9LILI|nr:hypothetical protein MUK42_32294 [Musa troglodytarum]
MKPQTFTLPTMLLLILLIMGHFSSLSSGIRVMRKEAENSREGELSSQSSAYFTKISPSQAIYEDDETSSIYGVSDRGVPQGPNPLHN